MKDNKNMIKTKNNRAERKSTGKKKFYGIVEYTVQVLDKETGKTRSEKKTGVIKTEEKLTKLQASNELKSMAKSLNAKLTFVGALGN